MTKQIPGELSDGWRQGCFMIPAVRRVNSTSSSSSSKPAVDPDAYTRPFVSFMTENPTIFHTVSHFSTQLKSHGFVELSERESWTLKKGGRYFVSRNGSAMIAFVVGDRFESGNGAAIVAGHIDALAARLKPVSTVENKAGYVQLGVAPYAGGMNSTWWDRDLSIGGRVIVKDSQTGKVSSRLVKLGWPIARIPTLAPHFGAAAQGPFNKETQMVPIIGLENSEDDVKIPADTFAATQPPRLVRAICKELGVTDYGSILNWELELYDAQPAQVGGLDKEFIFAGRIDDKLCSWAAVEALLASLEDSRPSSILKMVCLFDDEEIGSLLRQGARSNFLSSILKRTVTQFHKSEMIEELTARTFASSFIVSSDVIHAVNPNFLNAYLASHSPQLNVGVAVSCDPNGHMTTDSVSMSILSEIAACCDAKLQIFQIRNDSRSGGTIGPSLSSNTGIRAVDCGIPQLSMHSIRATTGSRDPGLGVRLFKGVFDYYEEVDSRFA